MTTSHKYFCLFALALGLIFSSCNRNGCTDPLALNFDSRANSNDGSCFYPSILSNIISVMPFEWVGDGEIQTALIGVPDITPEVMTNGVVLCYLVEPDGLQIQLPVSISNPRFTSHFWYNFTPGEIEFVIQDDDGLTAPPADRVDYRLVIIDQFAFKEHPEIDYANYEEVAAAFGIDE